MDASTGDVYIAGYVSASLDNQTFVGANNFDIVLLKYDASGTWIWTRLRGTTGSDRAYGGKQKASGNALTFKLFFTISSQPCSINTIADIIRKSLVALVGASYTFEIFRVHL